MTAPQCLTLLVGLNGFTLCSGIICEELNGDEYRAVPFLNTEENNQSMEIGYILQEKISLSVKSAICILII